MKSMGLERVQYIPRELKAGMLYVSEEHEVACHLCACGCGSKVTTPLGPAEWRVTERNGRPTLYPSIGSWQLPCRSHYFISEGVVHWAPQWSDAQVVAGRLAEEKRREAYYTSRRQQQGIWYRIWSLVRGFVGL